MELIKELRESDIIKEGKDEFETNYSVRKSSRGVIVNQENKIALIFVSSEGYYKLPGGDREAGEDKFITFNREVLEETGCEVDIIKELGLIIEYRNKMKELKFSYCFVGRVKEDTGTLALTKKEVERGFQLKWVGIDEAINLVKNSQPKSYAGMFVRYRDLIILSKARTS
jgi:8-oxo-dGTP diphosphatase